MNAAIDVRSIVPTIRVPTLVIHRTDDARLNSRADAISRSTSGMRASLKSGRDHPIWTGDVDRVVDEIEEFVTGARPEADHDRVLATMLIAKLVSPGTIAAKLGDRHWGERVERFRHDAGEIVARHRGQPIIVGTEEIGRDLTDRRDQYVARRPCAKRRPRSNLCSPRVSMQGEISLRETPPLASRCM